jgi:TM2 domain-containing membrane protein YozV
MLIALLLSWLVPGAGYMIYGRWGRGLTHFVTVGLTFGLGLVLHGSVLWPTWSFRSEDFNLINNFTFVTQMGSGLPALASFLASQATGAQAGSMSWLGGIHSHTNFELGSYYLIVAGALNYFAVGNLFDRINRPDASIDEPESA